MRILHFSDIHLNIDNIDEVIDFYNAAFCEKLENLGFHSKIDLVLITGDLVDRGGSSLSNYPKERDDENHYDLFDRFIIRPIASKLKISLDRFLFVPGNHDVEEEMISWFDDKTMFNKIKLSENNPDKLNRLFKDLKNPHDSRLRTFKDYEKNYHRNTILMKEYFQTDFHSCCIKEINGQKIGILLINDSWMCKSLKFEGESNKLFFGQMQLNNCLRWLEEKSTVFNICLFHHDLSDFIEELEVRRILVNKPIHFVFYGHHHSPDFRNISNKENSCFLFRVGAGVINHRTIDDEHKSSFQIIDYNEFNHSLQKVRYFIYERDKGIFEEKTELLEINENLPSIINHEGSKQIENLDIKKFNDYEERI